MKTRLLSEIDEFLAASGLSEYNFGFQSARNGRLVERLRAGGRVWPETEAMVRAYIKAERTRRARQDRAA